MINAFFRKNLSRVALAMLMAVLLTGTGVAGQTPGVNGLMAFWFEAPEAAAKSLAIADPNSAFFEVVLDPDTTSEVRDLAHSSWSPDGKQIVFSGLSGDPEDFVYRLYVIDTDGSNLQQLQWDDNGTSRPLESCYNFEWAENGLIYTACFDDSPNGSVAFDPDTGQLLHLCEGIHHENPALSPDGQTLVMVDFGDSILTAPASAPCDTTLLSTNPEVLQPSHTIWGTDGNTIFFVERNATSPRDLMSAPADGGTTTLIRENAFSVAPSPDGTLLGFVDFQTRHINIASMDGSNAVDLFAQWGVEGSAGGLSWFSQEDLLFGDRFEDDQ